MAISIYLHIPYCLQRCRYCDFTTFERSEILPPEKYVDQLLTEIRSRHSRWIEREVKTIYFGGGTPSLLPSGLIISILEELANAGFRWGSSSEVTIEINPATMDERKLEDYLKGGINRFSVGAQTFNDAHLRACGRKHTAEETRTTLRILQKYSLNYSFDLLFALPNQSLCELKQDLDEVGRFAPPHLSAYCLTVPEGHPMSRGRAPEEEQVAMFGMIDSNLKEIELKKYEISNFAKPGFESRHNMVYWSDESYWGIGLSAHSYDPWSGLYGERFWNTKDLGVYAQQCAFTELPESQRERLLEHEAMTDLCHMFLRTRRGLPKAALRKFQAPSSAKILEELEKLVQDGYTTQSEHGFSLSPKGELVSNHVFERLTFLPS